VETGTLFHRARAAVLSALLGSGADAERTGLGLGARFIVTILSLGIATLIWIAATRFMGFVGAASFYFPAILVVTVFAGWEFGAGSVPICVAVIWTLAAGRLPGWMAVGGRLPAAPIVIFAAAGWVEVLLAGFLCELLRDAWRTERSLRKQAEQHERDAGARELALGEARHRLKNLMTIIEALAKFSASRSGESENIDAYLHRFLGRLRALGAASDLVLKYGPGVLEANAVIGAALEPFLSESPRQLHFEGPELALSEHFSGALAMAVHELATNALKYGALSVPSGSVMFRWTVTPRDGGEEVVFSWKEQGGPPPQKPEREGYGHRMIRTVAARETDGRVILDFPPEGLVCLMSYRRPPGPSPANALE
jgi:two-component sensor histidine kinase